MSRQSYDNDVIHFQAIFNFSKTIDIIYHWKGNFILFGPWSKNEPDSKYGPSKLCDYFINFKLELSFGKPKQIINPSKDNFMLQKASSWIKSYRTTVK